MKYPNNNLINTAQNKKNKTCVLLGHWRITGGTILDMYLILIETYWWGDGDDNDDDKNEVRSQQVLNSWQFWQHMFVKVYAQEIERSNAFNVNAINM